MTEEVLTDLISANLSETNSSVFNQQNNFSLPSARTVLTIPLYIYISTSVMNLVLFCIGILGNALVVLVVVRVREMRTPVNMFLVSLSAADMLVLLICQPAGLMEFFTEKRWYLGDFICKIVPVMEHSMINVSILTMLAVTAERYCAICHPFKRRMTCTVSTAVRSNLAIWITGFLMTSPILFMTSLDDARSYDGAPIKVCRTLVNETWRRTYVVLMFVTLFAFPFILLIVMYAQIIRQLFSENAKLITHRNSSAMTTLKSRKQVVRMLIFIIVLFFLSLFPIRCLTLWLIFSPPSNIQKLGLEAYLNLLSWTRILMYVNSAGNPIIYNLSSTKFKTAFGRILRGRHQRNNSNTSRCTLAQRLKRVEVNRRATGEIRLYTGQGRLRIQHPRLIYLRPREDHLYCLKTNRVPQLEAEDSLPLGHGKLPEDRSKSDDQETSSCSEPISSDKDGAFLILPLTLVEVQQKRDSEE